MNICWPGTSPVHPPSPASELREGVADQPDRRLDRRLAVAAHLLGWPVPEPAPEFASAMRAADSARGDFESMQAKVDVSEARNEELAQRVGNLETENAELRQDAVDAEARARANSPEQQSTPDNSPESREQFEQSGTPGVLTQRE